ncbi:MAG: DUF1552 domain-containing protein [Sandaracinus sp.]|nr:DUF1552 domain-containing protein [Myxococcales bacterium]MCB9617418.1 DUF1552 domain-containing protein [Sandaracinus sp.]MCB9636467.1 DUF1552 domain-containing protein [Sandaracinus sp.]
MTTHKTSRRSFLSALGLGAAGSLLAPWVPMLESEAHAQGTIPKRLVLFVTGNGNLRNTWVPDAGRVLGPSMAPLARHESRLVVCAEGIEQRVFRSGGEGRDHVRSHPQLLTARRIGEDRATAATGISIDQHVAATLGPDRPFPVLSLGAGNTATYSFTGPNAPYAAVNNPQTVLDRVFAGVGGATPDARDVARQRILETVHGHLGAVRPRIAPADRHRIDAHVERLEDVRRRLATASSLVCERPDLTVPSRSWGSAEGHRDAPDLQARLLAAALGCDLTRVGMVTLGNSGNVGLQYSWLGTNRDAHDIAHAARGGRGETEAMEIQTRIDEWHAERFAVLLDQLEDTPERDGSSVLDHSLVVWVSPLAQGNHSVSDMPFVLAGGLVRGGRAVRVHDRTHNDFLVSLCSLLGMPDRSFGEAEFCSGPIEELLS